MIELNNTIKGMIEQAKQLDHDDTDLDDVETTPSQTDDLLAYYEQELRRANAIIDQKKDDVFNDVLNLTTRGQVERAIVSYSADYLLDLNLSLDATSELCYSLIDIAQRFNTVPNKFWWDLAKFRNTLGMSTETLTPRRKLDL